MSGKASALRRTLHTARRPEIVRRCSRALAFFEMDAVCRCGRARLTNGCYMRESAAYLARHPSLPERL